MTVTRRIIMQKARRHTFVLRPLVSVWFQVQYPPLTGVLPIFRSRYFPLSVAGEYLALGDGPPGFRPRSTCAVLLGDTTGHSLMSRAGLSPAMAPLSNGFRYQSMYHCVGPTTPGSMPPGLGFSLFARRYWGNRVFFLLLRLLRCFS